MDFVWALYNRATIAGQALWASSLSSAIILLSSVSIIEYTQDKTMILPAAAGAFVGTFLAMKVKK